MRKRILFIVLFAWSGILHAFSQQQANYELANEFQAFGLGGNFTANSLNLWPNEINGTDKFWFEFHTTVGNDLEDTLEDLNIYNNLNERKKYKVKIQLKDEIFEEDCYINLFQPGEIHIDHNPQEGEDNINWRFLIPIAEIKEEQNSLLKGGYVVDPTKIKVDGWNYDNNKPVKFENNIVSVSLERILERTNFTV